MAMNMVFSSAELANAGDSSSQLKTDGHREGHGVTRRRRDREARHHIRLNAYPAYRFTRARSASYRRVVGWAKPTGPAFGRPDDRLRVPTKARGMVGTAHRSRACPTSALKKVSKSATADFD